MIFALWQPFGNWVGLRLNAWLIGAVFVFSSLPQQTGVVVGKVTDPEGGALPGVTIVLKLEGRSLTAVTNAKGEYRFDRVWPDRYRIEASLAGFTTAAEDGVVIDSARPTTWNAKLMVAHRNMLDPFLDFQTRAKAFAGSDAIDCGQHQISKNQIRVPLSDLERSLSCSVAAAALKKPFWTSQERQGVDGTIFYGFAAGANGMVHLLTYNSSPCGGPDCAPQFSIQLCSTPSIKDGRQGSPYFSCSK